MFDNPVILNLQNFKRDSYISVICQASDYAVEDRKADAVAHLAVARSQNTGNGILGDTKDERQLLELPVFFGVYSKIHRFHSKGISSALFEFE